MCGFASEVIWNDNLFKDLVHNQFSKITEAGLPIAKPCLLVNEITTIQNKINQFNKIL